ncbi:phosphoribosyltransferase [Acuticoccus mangrovi]|uniref:Phosphoribosyltransferase n=1 Tax=Acuticoccus mangrovi TaxID=2796142 RepID=A0A934IDI3_9HYPH|nr:phosphoribosyltransferase [Acuticoccus mangrovi]MBJ3774559.1 phosphoribosyltransferase [Acuticoccus mangrovi]
MDDIPSAPSDDDFVAPTTDRWQTILPADHPAGAAKPPYRYTYPARLLDGRVLELPLRRLPDGERAVASLIANHASFTVAAALADTMASLAGDAEVVVGMPTLGLVFAPLVAERLGHPNYIPLGYSQKFWYREALSEPVRSVTTPGAGKRVFIDPNLLPRLEGRRVVLVDDAVSSGTTMVAVMRLLARLGARPQKIVVAMRQGVLWRAALKADAALVTGVFAGPLFRRVPGGWAPIEGTMDA